MIRGSKSGKSAHWQSPLWIPYDEMEFVERLIKLN